MKINDKALKITRISLLGVGLAVMNAAPAIQEVEACYSCNAGGRACLNTSSGYTTCTVNLNGCRGSGNFCFSY